jgi:hypothetical protein
MSWQPIETAPKDGTPFLCWLSGLPYAARYDKYGRLIWYWHRNHATGPAHRVHIVDGRRMLEEIKPEDRPDYQVSGMLWVNGFEAKATHWMPLPSPPTGPDQRPGIGQDREQG